MHVEILLKIINNGRAGSQNRRNIVLHCLGTRSPFYNLLKEIVGCFGMVKKLKQFHMNSLFSGVQYNVDFSRNQKKLSQRELKWHVWNRRNIIVIFGGKLVIVLFYGKMIITATSCLFVEEV